MFECGILSELGVSGATVVLFENAFAAVAVQSKQFLARAFNIFGVSWLKPQISKNPFMASVAGIFRSGLGRAILITTNLCKIGEMFQIIRQFFGVSKKCSRLKKMLLTWHDR